MPNQTITFVSPATPGVNGIGTIASDLGLTSKMVSSVEEIFPMLSDTSFNTDLIGLDLQHLKTNTKADIYEIISALRTLLNCTVYRPSQGKPKKRETKILALIGDETAIGTIKQTHKLIDGFLINPGGKFSRTDAKSQIETVLSGDLRIPKVVQDMLRKHKNREKSTSGTITLTARQQQIYNLVVDKGASNKAIGRLLSISESTVKLHMTAILKKYGVRNRTQLAVFTKKSAVNTVSTSQENK